MPELTNPSAVGIKYPDAVVDGVLMEFKTITGGIRQIEERFKESQLKAGQVFLKIDGDLPKDAVMKKLEGTIIRKDYRGGYVIVYFSGTGKIYYWNVDDLR